MQFIIAAKGAFHDSAKAGIPFLKHSKDNHERHSSQRQINICLMWWKNIETRSVKVLGSERAAELFKEVT